MIQRSPSDPSAAMAQIPGGCFVLTANCEGRRGAVLVKWVQQCSDQPPMVMVALGKGQMVEPLIRNSRSFALCQVSDADRFLMRKLTDELPEDEDPLISFMTIAAPSGSPVLQRAAAFLDCEVVRHIELDCDHRIYVGQVHHGGVLNPALMPIADSADNGDRPSNGAGAPHGEAASRWNGRTPQAPAASDSDRPCG